MLTEMRAAMYSTSPAVVDRRYYPRQSISGGLAVELRLQVGGDKPAVLLTRGMVKNISSGGVSCAIGLAVPNGTQVNVRFPTIPAGATLSPSSVGGQVVRTESLGGVPERIAIAFNKPLTQLNLESGRPALSRRREVSVPSLPVGRHATSNRAAC
ncbi:MAG: PilZ domain-containing protein [Acidobacteriota bacterium]